ncbi:MAG: hypothetical protein GVY35_04955 [Bacteroidetes bacterium]|jgi:hypothetical protein|nr:hypothetical protein [Bacteroidota bacterium]
MSGSFWMNVLKAFLAVGFIGGIAVDVIYRGVSWSGGMMWALGGMATYGLYRFYARGSARRPAYQARWEGLFEREPDAEPGENEP